MLLSYLGGQVRLGYHSLDTPTLVPLNYEWSAQPKGKVHQKQCIVAMMTKGSRSYQMTLIVLLRSVCFYFGGPVECFLGCLLPNAFFGGSGQTWSFYHPCRRGKRVSVSLNLSSFVCSTKKTTCFLPNKILHVIVTFHHPQPILEVGGLLVFHMAEPSI